MSTRTRVILSVGGDNGGKVAGIPRSIEFLQHWHKSYGKKLPVKTTQKEYLVALMKNVIRVMPDICGHSALRTTWLRMYKEPRGTRYNRSRYVRAAQELRVMSTTKQAKKNKKKLNLSALYDRLVPVAETPTFIRRPSSVAWSTYNTIETQTGRIASRPASAVNAEVPTPPTRSVNWNEIFPTEERDNDPFI